MVVFSDQVGGLRNYKVIVVAKPWRADMVGFLPYASKNITSINEVATCSSDYICNLLTKLLKIRRLKHDNLSS